MTGGGATGASGITPVAASRSSIGDDVSGSFPVGLSDLRLCAPVIAHCVSNQLSGVFGWSLYFRVWCPGGPVTFLCFTGFAVPPPPNLAIDQGRGHAWVPPSAPSGGPFVFLGLKGSVTSKGVLFLAILAHPDCAWHIQHPAFK